MKKLSEIIGTPIKDAIPLKRFRLETFYTSKRVYLVDALDQNEAEEKFERGESFLKEEYDDTEYVDLCREDDGA